MKKITCSFFIIIFTVGSVIAQNKYMIYFKDKGSLGKKSLFSVEQKEIIANKILTKKSIERRKKTLGNNYITFEDLPLEKSYLSVLKNNNIKIIHSLKWFNAVSVLLNKEQFEVVSSLPFVKKVEKVKKIKFDRKEINKINKSEKLNNKSANSNYTYDYGPSLTQNELSDIPQVHDMGITGERVIIGLLDSGFEWATPNALKNKTVIAEHDFVFNDDITSNEAEDISYQHNHGTSVFSILAGFDPGNLIGPAFNAQFLLAKTEYIPTETHVEEDNYAAALEWMDSIGVDITTSSLGYSDFDTGEFSYTYEDMDGNTTIVTKAAEMAFDKGIVVITSAGNEGANSWHYITAPGDGFNTITIGAVSPSNVVASFSSRGPTYDGRIKPEIVAQGISVYNSVAETDAGYSYGSGTSFSAPIAAGIAGLLLSAYPHLTNKQVRSILMESGDNVASPNNDIGFGLISALKAVTYPNLERVGSNYKLNKLFASDLDINSNTVEIIFEDGSRIPMSKNLKNIFTADLNGLSTGENYKFYISYLDSQNNPHREPEDKMYNFTFGNLNIDLILTNVEESGVIPKEFYLYQNYPNPFNPTTTIKYSVPNVGTSHDLSLQIKVYDILGREVATLVNKPHQPGNYSIDFNASGLTSGVYFYQLQAGDFVQTKKLILLR